jgi:hypothetical protein
MDAGAPATLQRRRHRLTVLANALGAAAAPAAAAVPAAAAAAARELQLAATMNDEAVSEEEARAGAPAKSGGVPFFHREPTTGVFQPPELALDDTVGLKQHLDEFGFVVLRGLVSKDFISQCRQAFEPRLAEYISRKGPNDPATRNRGPYRHYIDLPMRAPFVDIFRSEHLYSLLIMVLGRDCWCNQLASDTPLGAGSTYQAVHGDTGPHGGEPCRHVAVNWPLCTIDESNGPFEMAVSSPGTHRRPDTEARRAIESGEATLQRLLMDEGDVLVRDPRTVHRASPNL